MDKINQIWETYRASWNNDDSVKRTDKLKEIMTEDFEYRDPNIELKGSEQLSDYMSQFQKEFVGASFVITDFQFHHDKSLSHWNMVNTENEVVGNGTDYAVYENGKLKQITGFFKQG
ncbi:nuclear transport factor 2 family protein [Flavivirga algicola]|uniref:Nuclear transport factor 2 family protein n=1 Tax=Flavivirga algicola TaxID=2729136 RepID=A0ABX1S446_9FLAO|nr:nuclear transport factor 2 family protein [Flavivirga algicola]NMH89963.1 nuclear transport factor 2 family protein [Flavivirga algicola]